MKVHTSELKEEIKKLGRELDSKITYGTTELGNEELNSVTPHYESTILKSVMKQLDVDSNVEIPLETIINYQFGVKVGNGYEYLDYGNYVVYKVEKQEDTRSWKITCYDKMLYAMKPYESLGVSFPISIKDYLQAICTKLGLTLASGNFANEDKMIMNELYLDASGNGLDYTFRDVLDEIAQATGSTICINENDELEVRYPKNVGEYETVEGTDLLLENVDDGKDIDYELNGDTTQDGTPTPEAPIEVQTVTGRQEISIMKKNLIDIGTSNEDYVNAGSSSHPSWLSVDDKIISLVIQSAGGTVAYRNKNLKGGNTFTISSTFSMNYGRYYIRLRNNDDSGWLTNSDTSIDGFTYNSAYRGWFAIIQDEGDANITVNIPDCLYWQLGIGYSSSNVGSTQTVTNLQLEKGIVATEYEEYVEQSYEINLGKNLVDLSTLEYGYVASNGSTTTTHTNGEKKSPFIKVEPNTKYIFSIIETSDTYNNWIGIGEYTARSTASTYFVRRQTMTTTTQTYFAFTTSATTQYVILSARNLENASKIQFEKGTETTTYAEYKEPIELCEIGNYQDRIFKGSGKNLLNLKNELWQTSGGISKVYNDDTSISLSGTATATWNYVTNVISQSIEPGTYTFSINKKLSYRIYIVINYEDNTSSTHIILPDSKSVTFTTSKYGVSYRISCSAMTNGKTYNDTIFIQLEKSAEASKYEPYNSAGKWLLHKEIGKVVLDGTENINYRGDGRFDIEIPSNNGTYAILGLCNYYLYTNNWDTHTNTNGTFSIQNINWGANKCRMSFKNTNYSSLSDVQAGLSLNNVIIYFQITSNIGVPTTTEITDTELINQLNAVELLEGMNNISITSGDLSTPLKLTYLSQMDTIDEEYLKDVNVNFGEKFGPVNSVVLSRAAESDSIYQMDEESVEQNGLTEVKIKDNQILNGNNRDEFLPSIFEKLNGLEYYLTDFSSTGVTYYDLLDKYKINVFDNSYKTIMLNNEVDITQGLEEQIYAERLEQSETDYTKSDKTDRKINQAYIIVDKQNQQINSVVQSINTLQSVVNNQGEQVDALGTRLTQTVDNITASVTSIEGQIENGVKLVKTTSVIIDDSGLNVSTDNSKISTTMTNNSFEIKDSGDNMLAFFGYDETENISKSQMDNLTVTNYFVSGYHRTEKFERNGEKRTGHFYIG